MKLSHLIATLAISLLSCAATAGGSHADSHDDTPIGLPGIASEVTRTVHIEMKDDMRFHAPILAAQQGETIRFMVKNSGQLKHEMVLGTEKDLKEHGEAMKKNPEMEHADANMVAVEPGQTGEIVWHFTRAGKIDFACLQPGHYDAGMKGQVNVASSLAGAAEMTDGQIRKIDKDNQTLTIKHGALKNLDMPGMTMVFKVSNPAMLDQVKAGDTVKFTADKVNGALTVMSLEKTK